MIDATITWCGSLNGRWRSIRSTSIGGVSADADRYLLLSRDDQPVLRVDAHLKGGEYFAFQDAVVWYEWLVIGWGECVYLVDIHSALTVRHSLDMYFGSLYANDAYLLVASGNRLWRFRRDGSVQWSSVALGIDGVLVHDVSNDVIEGDGEMLREIGMLHQIGYAAGKAQLTRVVAGAERNLLPL